VRALESHCIGKKSLTHELFSSFTILLENEQQAVTTTTLSLILIIHKPHFLSPSRYGVEILLFIFSTRSLPPRLYSKSHNISSRPHLERAEV
jgi:hypothetical protein